VSCFGYRRDSYQSRGGTERGTQQENAYTKLAITNRIPVTAKLGRVNEASHCNVLRSPWLKFIVEHKKTDEL